jgi:hypothetical protein
MPSSSRDFETQVDVSIATFARRVSHGIDSNAASTDSVPRPAAYRLGGAPLVFEID